MFNLELRDSSECAAAFAENRVHDATVDVLAAIGDIPVGAGGEITCYGGSVFTEKGTEIEHTRTGKDEAAWRKGQIRRSAKKLGKVFNFTTRKNSDDDSYTLFLKRIS